MCLLNYILLTLVTVTQSLPPGTPPLRTRPSLNLSNIIQEHPEFQQTLLNTTVVPYIAEECQGKAFLKREMVCVSYVEMIKMLDTSLDTIKVNKLDASKLNDLQTLVGFEQALSKYNQDEVNGFCSKFPSLIPTDLEYPESAKLYKFANNSYKCAALCSEITDGDAVTVKPICRIFAAGFQFASETKALAQQNVGTGIKNGSSEKGPETDIQKPEGAANPDVKTNSTAKSDVVLNPDVPFVGESASGPEVEKTAEDPNPIGKPADKNVDNVDLLQEPLGNQNNQRKETVAKPNSSNNQVTESGTSISKSEDSNLEPIVKPSNPQPSLEEALEKQNTKPVTDIDESLLENNNDLDETNKLSEIDINNKDDDSTEEFEENKPNEDVAENVEDEINSQKVAHKFPQEQTPSREQLLGSQNDPFYDDTDSNFFTYFMFLLLVCVIAYVVYHNKTKMLALMLEGRRSSTSGRSGLSRRKHTAAYRKLDSNLEEAITSSANGRSTQVIY